MLYDFCVIGGGIIGLATATALLALRPGAGLVLLEKEEALARHQTGHNSGVIHSGLYYQPNSLKATLCRRGATATKEFCRAHDIPFETCGKLVVATNPLELQRMEALCRRAGENGIKVDRLDETELRRREPNIAGRGALFVAETGIVDYRRVCAAMAETIRNSGGTIELGTVVTGINETPQEVRVVAGEREWTAGHVIACAGLQADRLARLSGLSADFRIIPFRGEYYQLPPEKNGLINHLIYPVPNPDLPFLGIHLTRMIGGNVTLGPNAVLGFSREGYGKFSVNRRDVADALKFPGFWRMGRRNWKTGMSEMINSVLKSRYLAACRMYCPGLELDDLLPYEAGIRAQAVRRDGSFVEDFNLLETGRSLHVCNAPSPAATSALPIGKAIAERILAREELKMTHPVFHGG